MIRQITLTSGFSAVPHLPATTLWQQHQAKGLNLSITKPNVIVGPNGSGKTALLTLLSIQTLTYFTPATALDDHYTRGLDCDSWWSERTWRDDPAFLPGAVFKTDNAPAVFYRPVHIPGNDDSVAAAMMCGYFNEARAFGNAVKQKSSGQACQALLVRLHRALTAPAEAFKYAELNWSAGTEPRDLTKLGYVGPWDYRSEVLKVRRNSYKTGMPLILMDEPEQSLDMRAELALWRAIAGADCSTRQIVVASHSLYPLLHPECFNLIVAEPGYVDVIRGQLS